jgi:hypothetical protein
MSPRAAETGKAGDAVEGPELVVNEIFGPT